MSLFRGYFVPNGMDPNGENWVYCNFVCGPCVTSLVAVCSGVCAGSHWDQPGESFGSCFDKCFMAIVTLEIDRATGGGHAWTVACSIGCLGCLSEGIKSVIPKPPIPNPPVVLPPRPPVPPKADPCWGLAA